MEKSSSKSSKSSLGAGESLVELATLGRAHGIRGGITLNIDQSMADAVRPGLRIWLQQASASTEYEISAVGRPGKRIVVELCDVRDRNLAESLTGARLMIRRDDLPKLGKHEYYDFELIGAVVVTVTGETLGTVVEIFATAANDVYVVRGEGQREILVPAFSGAVLEIRRADKQIVVNPTALEYSDHDD